MSSNEEIAARVKPIIRWVGGKSRLLSRILPEAPLVIQDYYEPFLGGGAVYLALYRRVEGNAYLSDVNPHLIAGWQGYADPTEQFLETLMDFERQDSEDFYYAMRAQTPTNQFEMATRFAYLNATSWNHLWRENSKTGAMNTPWGKRAFKVPPSDRLSEFTDALKGARIVLQDFRDALQSAQAGDFVYLDPPYLPIWTNPEEKEPTSKFNRYNARTFGSRDLQDLAECCRELDEKGVAWLLSNRDTEQVRELFSFARIKTFTTTRSVAAHSKRSVESRQSPEVLILGANLGV